MLHHRAVRFRSAPSFVSALALAVTLPACSAGAPSQDDGGALPPEQPVDESAPTAPSASPSTPAPSGARGMTPHPGASAAPPDEGDGGAAPGDTTPDSGSAPPVEPPLRWAAAPCDSDDVCESGHCSDGLCCDTACTDRFAACNLMRFEGVCTQRTGAVVDPVTGRDENDGTAEHPLKTLTAALSAAKPTWIITLNGGTYDSLSGERWPLRVPNYVNLAAAAGSKPVLSGGATVDGLILAGSSTLNGLTLRGFQTAVQAQQGTSSFDHVTVDTGGGFAFSGTAVATLSQVHMLDLSASALRASDHADVTLDAGSMSAVDAPGACVKILGVSVSGSAKVRASATGILNFDGDGFDVSGDAFLGLSAVGIMNTGRAPDCEGGGAQISARGGATVMLETTTLDHGRAAGIRVSESATVDVRGGVIGTHRDGAIVASGGSVTVTRGIISAGEQSPGIFATDARVRIDGASLSTNFIGVRVEGDSDLRMRDTHVGYCKMGVVSTGTARTHVDLGTEASPGNNVITSTSYAFTHSGKYDAPVYFDAFGNTWNPTAETDATGKYPRESIAAPFNDRNFWIPNWGPILKL